MNSRGRRSRDSRCPSRGGSGHMTSKDCGFIKVVSEESASQALVAALDKCFLMALDRNEEEPEKTFPVEGKSKSRGMSPRGSPSSKHSDGQNSGTLKKKSRRRDSSKLKDSDNCDEEDGHSTLKKKKVKKVKRHCDIHSKNSKENLSSVDNDSMVQNDSKSKNSELVCTCHKRSKSKIRRPDPEGGPNVSSLVPMDEYDKIIYNAEPLFSDAEENAVLDDQIKKDMERYHKRVQNPDIFSAALMVNSNTLLKFAIIGTELQNISNTSLRRVMFLSTPWLKITAHLLS